MNDKVEAGSGAVVPAQTLLAGAGVVVDLHERQLQALQASVDKTRGKLARLQRRLIRGELKKGRLRRKLLERKRALSELEQRLTGLQEENRG
jgi:hypothetical protein